MRKFDRRFKSGSPKARRNTPGLLAGCIVIFGLCLSALAAWTGRPLQQSRTFETQQEVMVSSRGMDTWLEFFACNPLENMELIEAVLATNGAETDLNTKPPPEVRIPLGKAFGASDRRVILDRSTTCELAAEPRG